MLLVENTIFTHASIKEEVDSSTNEKTHKIEGIFMSAEERNRNGRIYPREVLEQAVNDYQSVILEGNSYGAMDHPNHLTISLREASHLITKLEMIGDDVYGTAVLIPETEEEKKIKNIRKIKGSVGVSSRGAGEIKEVNGQSYVSEGFKIITVDIVGRPSAPRAHVESIQESEIQQDYIFENGMFVRRHRVVENKPFNESDYENLLRRFSNYYTNKP